MDTVLLALKTVPGGALIVSGKARLSKDPSFAPTPDSTIASLAALEADYTGYAAGGIAVVLTTSLNLSPGCLGDLATALFEATGSAVTNTVYGYWVDDGTSVVCGERFAGGGVVAFQVAGDFLDLTVLLPMQLIQATE
jgi:hypothetical protein